MTDARTPTARPRGRGPGRPFRKGQSGNPSGRRADLGHVRELARTHTEDAIAALAGIMRDGDEPAAARARAAELLLDRGWGRPTQPISGEGGGPIETRSLHELTDEQLLALALAGAKARP